jgi:AraC family transcriptional regulator
LEKAASLIVSNPHETITDIAFKCGFTDISIFSRNFKNRFQISATDYRKQKGDKSNLSQPESKKQQARGKPSMYFCQETNTLKWRTTMELNKSVEVKVLPKMTVAYIRHIGPYKGNEKLFEKLWNKLFAWAGPRGLIGGPDFRSLIIYHDDPNVTLEDKLRMSVCITIPPGTKVDGEIGKMDLEAATYVVARFVVSAPEFQLAWEWLYGQWFPASGYQPDDKPCFEMYPEEPKGGKFTVDICVPVKPL